MNLSESNQLLEGQDPFTGEWLEIHLEKGLIKEIVRSKKDKKAEVYVSPGLVDQQVNGFVGTLFTGAEFDLSGSEKMMKALFAKGVIRILPTIITSSKEKIIEALSKIVQYRKESKVLKDAWPGIHIEGPWISGTDGPRGAHSKKDTRDPSISEWKEFQEVAEGLILHVTLAPEREGAISMIEQLKKDGVIVALGHHEADRETVRRAFDAGATLITHFGNGCHLEQHRSESYFWSVLGDPRATLTLVTDGFHINQDQVKTAYHCKEKSNLMLTSDSSHIAGLPPGEYKMNELEVVLEDSGRLGMKDSPMLAGSSISQKEAIETLLDWEICSLKEALEMSCINQAKTFRIPQHIRWEKQDPFSGILFEKEGGKLKIRESWLEGERVYFHE